MVWVASSSQVSIVVEEGAYYNHVHSRSIRGGVYGADSTVDDG